MNKWKRGGSERIPKITKGKNGWKIFMIRDPAMTPMLMADYIKAQWLAATKNMATANPSRTVLLYITRMDQLCFTNQKLMIKPEYLIINKKNNSTT